MIPKDLTLGWFKDDIILLKTAPICEITPYTYNSLAGGCIPAVQRVI